MPSHAGTAETVDGRAETLFDNVHFISPIMPGLRPLRCRHLKSSKRVLGMSNQRLPIGLVEVRPR